MTKSLTDSDAMVFALLWVYFEKNQPDKLFGDLSKEGFAALIYLSLIKSRVPASNIRQVSGCKFKDLSILVVSGRIALTYNTKGRGKMYAITYKDRKYLERLSTEFILASNNLQKNIISQSHEFTASIGARI
jgi:hypothetical protein